MRRQFFGDIKLQIKSMLNSKKITEKKKLRIAELFGKIKEVLVAYIKGQLVIMLVITLIFYLIFSFLDIKQALILSALTGVFSIIPAFGMITAAVITLIFVLLDGQKIFGLSLFPEAILIIIIYLIVNQIVDWIVSPLVIGKSLKIHPLILFFSVIIAVSLFGIVGAILTAPTLAVVRVIWESMKERND